MIQTFISKVKTITGTQVQPNARTCQAACVAMALGRTDILEVRRQLESIGDPGSPLVMSQYLKSHGANHDFTYDASLSQVREWLKAGEFLILHGWFTDSGHVIALDGVEIDSSNLSYRFHVRDPWSEFDFKAWRYNSNSEGYHGFYSSYGIYASCVVGQSRDDAAAIYRRGELDSNRNGAWVHRIKP